MKYLAQYQAGFLSSLLKGARLEVAKNKYVFFRGIFNSVSRLLNRLKIPSARPEPLSSCFFILFSVSFLSSSEV